jgi:hypothetical protein
LTSIASKISRSETGPPFEEVDEEGTGEAEPQVAARTRKGKDSFIFQDLRCKEPGKKRK